MIAYQDKIERSNIFSLNVLQQIRKLFSIVAELGKFRITFFVAISTSVGFILASGFISVNLFLTSLGVFLLASGSSAVNHVQERDYDKLMDRTSGRPIPSGRISVSFALTISLALIISGIGILLLFASITSVILGVIALFWYNIFYTPLKRITSLAVVPGSVIGAIPPMIGWTSAGGSLLDTQVIALALFFFIWQIPHFWLLFLLHNNDYKKGGFPTLSNLFSEIQIRRITFVWIAALAASCLLIPAFSVANSQITTFIISLLGIALVFQTKDLLKKTFKRVQFKYAFGYINVYVLIVVTLLMIDRLVITNF
jgi:protoheme IX farnesyltransferase